MAAMQFRSAWMALFLLPLSAAMADAESIRRNPGPQGGTRGAEARAAGESIKIVPRSGWEALEPRPYRAQTPVRFTIHHSAVELSPGADAARHLAGIQSWCMGEARNWADIPYHFIIGPDGEIFEGRDPLTEGESNTDYDTAGHLQINLLGDFSEQDPTKEQWESLVALVAWASTRFEIPTATIKAHRDFAPTACPGDRLYRDVKNGRLRKEADRILSGQKEDSPPETRAR